ncbi:hypothetical protein LENED_004191 [Lentinula edodes]|uniref:Uncharacterized protein n=1 Tax=Lentinula edodes TaxID=5353 RepID=A0A1Q3E683_LENED|nr:hypothetical protein LENED_004191 [Lentinula edodes]
MASNWIELCSPKETDTSTKRLDETQISAQSSANFPLRKIHTWFSAQNREEYRRHLSDAYAFFDSIQHSIEPCYLD